MAPHAAVERAAGPVMVRARTGAVVGSPEDCPVTVLFDGHLGTQHRAVVRAGILSVGEKMADGSSVGWSLARVLQHQGYTIRADGVLVAKDGRRFDATPWPGGSPFDSPVQQNWIVALDGKPFVPSWIADLDEDEARVAIGETDRPAFTRRFDPPMSNRKSRRRMAALQLVR